MYKKNSNEIRITFKIKVIAIFSYNFITYYIRGPTIKIVKKL